jgi:hypothetical protein
VDTDVQAFMRTLGRTDYRRRAETLGKSLGAALAEALRASDEPPAESGWSYPTGEGSWEALSLRQRLAAVHMSEGLGPDNAAEMLHLRPQLINSWASGPTFRHATDQRRRHPLRRSAIRNLRQVYEAERLSRREMMGLFDVVAEDGKEWGHER